MPIINFTTSDILRQKLIDEGWYGAKITQILGPTTSSKGDSINFEYQFTLNEKSPTPGKVIHHTFNSKAISMMLPLVAACKGVTMKEVTDSPSGFQLNTEDHMGKDVDVYVYRDLYQGQYSNKINNFAPSGSVAGKAPAF